MQALLSLLAFAVWLATSLLATSGAQAVALPVEWELEIQIGTSPTRIGVAGVGVAGVNGSGGLGALSSLEIPAGMIASATVSLDVTDPAATPIEGILLTVANGAGSFAIGGGGDLGGVMALPGRERFCLFANCGAAVANLSVPLTPIGAGDVNYAIGSVNLKVTGAAWTTGTATAVGLGPSTATGYAHGPASATGSTARVGGSLQLVTPFTVATNVQADGPLTAFAFLTLRFVPEPASALLVATGLVALARSRRSRTCPASGIIPRTDRSGPVGRYRCSAGRLGISQGDGPRSARRSRSWWRCMLLPRPRKVSRRTLDAFRLRSMPLRLPEMLGSSSSSAMA